MKILLKLCILFMEKKKKRILLGLTDHSGLIKLLSKQQIK